MDATAQKYVDLFRSVKIASAATVDEQGRPQSRIINVMIATDEGMVIVTSRGKPFWKQLMDTGRIALSAMCPDCQSPIASRRSIACNAACARQTAPPALSSACIPNRSKESRAWNF